MIGTDKQIAFAEQCIAAAQAQWARELQRPMGTIQVDQDGTQRLTVQWLRLVDAQQIAEAEALTAQVRPWGMTCVVQRDGGFSVDAGSVISALRRYL